MPAEPDGDKLEAELYAEAFERCFNNLPPEDRNLLMTYYGVPEESRLVARKVVAEQLNVRWGALRVRIHRIKDKLAKCVKSELARLREDYSGPLPM